MSWVFPASQTIAFSQTRSHGVHESPTVSSCAWTYSGQRPGPTSDPAHRLSPVARVIWGSTDGAASPPGKIIGGARSCLCGAHRIRRPARRLPTGTGSRGYQHSPRLSPPEERCGSQCPWPAANSGGSALSRAGIAVRVGLMDLPSTFGERTWATRRRCWREAKYERHQRIHASDRRCREPAQRPVIGRPSTQRGR